jgi:hypothetical protein
MVAEDALFFHQLLLWMCAPSKSSIPEDGQQPYYTSTTDWTDMYEIKAKCNSCYGHVFKNPHIEEVVHFDVVVIKDGVHGGSKYVIYRRWQGGAEFCCEYVTKAHNHIRWVQIKQTYKLNLNATTAKCGQEGYDPA